MSRYVSHQPNVKSLSLNDLVHRDEKEQSVQQHPVKGTRLQSHQIFSAKLLGHLFVVDFQGERIDGHFLLIPSDFASFSGFIVAIQALSPILRLFFFIVLDQFSLQLIWWMLWYLTMIIVNHLSLRPLIYHF